MWTEVFAYVIMLNFKNITVYGGFRTVQKKNILAMKKKELVLWDTSFIEWNGWVHFGSEWDHRILGAGQQRMKPFFSIAFEI